METVPKIVQDLAAGSESCTRMGSAFFARILHRAALAYERDAVLRELLDRQAHRAYVGLLLGAAAHFRALSGKAPAIAAHYPSTGGDGDAEAAWRAVLSDIHANAGEYERLFQRHVQTNEVARAMPVLAAMLAFSHAARLPLRIFEIGSSAGLLLNFDRYFYRGEGWSWGDPSSPLHLHNRQESGKPRHLDAPLHIVERIGCDLNPLDPANDDDAATLLSYIWPDQRERFERLRAAIHIAREHPVDLTRGDGVAWAAAAAPCEGTATVLLHTVMTEHVTPSECAALYAAVEASASLARASAPFAWIRMERGERSYHTTLTHWPGGHETLIATSDGHAQHLRWYP